MSRASQGNQAADERDERGKSENDGQQHAGAVGQASRRRSSRARARAAAPRTKPTAPPAIASISCSVRKMAVTSAFVAPMAFMMPISPRRSITVVAEVAADRQRGRDQRRERDDPQQCADAREDAALGIGDAADRVHVRAGQHLLDLVADRRNVRRAEPAVVFGGRERFRIALGKRVGRLRQRADEKLPELAGMIRDLLRDGERNEHGVVFAFRPSKRCP